MMKLNSFTHLFGHANVCVTLLVASAVAVARPCTTEPKEKWLDLKGFEKTLKEQNYTVRKLNVTDESCYQLLGWDKNFAKVEVLFDPATGKKIKEEKHK